MRPFCSQHLSLVIFPSTKQQSNLKRKGTGRFWLSDTKSQLLSTSQTQTWRLTPGHKPKQERGQLLPQVLLGNFSYCGTSWESSTVSCRQSSRVLECTEDNFFRQAALPGGCNTGPESHQHRGANQWIQGWRQLGLQWWHSGGVHSLEEYGSGKR